MACRALVLASVLGVLLVSSTGCSLARSTLGGGGDGGGIDGGAHGHDAGMPSDGGPGASGCTPAGCDDSELCTDDACDATGACTHTPNARPCDDGVFCNGPDTCSGGTCSTHGSNPCTTGTTCDPITDACVGCIVDANCPADLDGPWSECTFADTCATAGTRTRMRQHFACVSSACVPTSTPETEACTRPSPDGTMCAAPSYGVFSDCDFGADPCAQTGMQFRAVTTSACAAGACVATTTEEPMTCMRTTDGMSCGTPTTDPWSACMVSAACGTTGTQTRTRTAPTCGGGVCDTHTTTESQDCTVGSVDGAPCGPPSCGAWSACTQTTPLSCDSRGTQTRACSTPTCTSSACHGTATATETQACTVDVGGAHCVQTQCGNCHVPGIFAGCPTGRSGTRRCSTSDGSCMNFGLGPTCVDWTPSGSDMPCTCP